MNLLQLEQSNWNGHDWGPWMLVKAGIRSELQAIMNGLAERYPYNTRWRIISVEETAGAE